MARIPAPPFPCSCRDGRSASWSTFRSRRTRSRRSSANCCSGSRTTCRSRWKISTAPTRRPGPRNRRSGWGGCSRRSALPMKRSCGRSPVPSCSIWSVLRPPPAANSPRPPSRWLNPAATISRSSRPADRLPSARGQVVGMLVFVATEKDTFTPEFAELLQRLADNVSFALENFARVDEKAQADQRIEYLASHDSLTDLPNRDMFNGMLRRTIDAAQRYQRQFAVLFIDLDRFKIINDSLGHEAGDMLLVEVGGRLRRALRSSDVVARLGADEFVVILEEAAERHEVERIASELLFVLSQPLQLS